MSEATQLDALAETPDADPPFFDFYAAAGRKKLGAASEWEWCVAEALDGPSHDVLLEGGIPKPGDDRKRWKGVVRQKVVVTRAEVDAACAEYERETGKCHSCAGVGRTLASSSYHEGKVTRTYRPCKRCDAIGSAPPTGQPSVPTAPSPDAPTETP